MLFLFRAENETRAHDAWALSRFFCHPRPPQGGMGSLVRAIVFNRRRKQKATHVGNSKVPQGGMGSLVRAIVFNRRRKQKATHVGNSKVPQGPRLKGALCLVRGWTMQVFRRKTAK